MSIFDVTPTRPIKFTELGYAIPPYYSEELNLKFIEDIKTIFNDEKGKFHSDNDERMAFYCRGVIETYPSESRRVSITDKPPLSEPTRV